MTKADELFRSDDWDAEAQALFDQRIRRLPKGRRAQRIHDKARALFYNRANDPVRKQAALALVERALVEAEGDAEEQAELLRWLALCHVKLGATATAISTLRRSIALVPGAFRLHQVDPAPEVSLARCLIDAGEHAESREVFDRHYRDCLAKHRRTPTPYAVLEEREVHDPTGAIVVDPEDSAEGIRVIYEFAEPPEPGVPGIATANRAALIALDRHFRIEDSACDRRFHPRVVFSADYLERLFLPQLGAYLGRVLVKERDARWSPRAPLLKSRVLVDGWACNPFRAAYDAVYYEVPLVRAYDEMQRVG